MPEVVIRNNNVTVYVTQPSTTETVYVLQGAAGPQGEPGVDGADGVVQSVVAGANVTVDSTDPANPVVSAATPVVDHGALTGLGDDDHAQYHNDARGDARYYTKAQTDTQVSSAVSTHAAAADPHGDRAYADSAIAGAAFRGARVTRSTAQSIPNNTTTTVSFDTELTDPSDMFAIGTPTRLTVPAGMAGKWLIIARLGYDSNATGQRECTIRKNGVNVSVTREAANPSDATWNDITYLGPCSAGDYFELVAWQTSGAALNTLASDIHTSFTAIYLGA